MRLPAFLLFSLILLCAPDPLQATSPLGYSTYFGGNGEDAISAMRIDSSGNIYIAGGTSSSNFPTTPGSFMPTSNAGQDCGGGRCMVAFITKLDPSGTKILYSTFFPAGIFAMDVDASGNVYLTGNADSSLPATSGALNGGKDLYVAKLNAAGSALHFAARFGSSAHDFPTGIAADAQGNAYIVGWSYGTDYPVTPGAFQTLQTGAFVTKLSSTGSELVYSARFGGSDTANNGQVGTHLEAIAVSPSGEAYVSGESDSKLFPTTSNAFQPKSAGNTDAVLFRLSADGSTLIYSTFLGGAGSACCHENAPAIAIDGSGNAWITGTARAGFPVTAGAFQKSILPNSGTDAFVARFNTNATGSASLVYSTLLGGSVDGTDHGIAIDTAGNAYVAGPASPFIFPTTPTAIQSCDSRGGIFVSALGPKGDHLLFSTVVGGSSAQDAAFALALDSSNNVYIAGQTWSTNYPTTAGSLQPVSGGGPDGFISRFSRASFTTLAPRAVICTPLNNAGLSSPFPVAGALQSGYPSRFISIDLDGISVYQLNRLNIIKRNISATSGTHQLSVRAETASGVTVTKTVTVRVK